MATVAKKYGLWTQEAQSASACAVPELHGEHMVPVWASGLSSQHGVHPGESLQVAVSGCLRECAEAQGKDVGCIAMHSSWLPRSMRRHA